MQLQIAVERSQLSLRNPLTRGSDGLTPGAPAAFFVCFGLGYLRFARENEAAGAPDAAALVTSLEFLQHHFA